MKTKKAQTEIIVTVLLVLIALAAVGLIAYFIMGQVRSGASAAGDKASCVKLDFQVTKAAAGTNITVKRNDDASVEVASVIATVDGSKWGQLDTNPSALGTVTVNRTQDSVTPLLLKDKPVEIGVVLKSGATCPSVATYAVTA